MKKILILCAVLVSQIAYSVERDCFTDTTFNEMELISNGYAPTVEFEGVTIPIPYKYKIQVRRPLVHWDFKATGLFCDGVAKITQRIEIEKTEDCYMCVAADNGGDFSVLESTTILSITTIGDFKVLEYISKTLHYVVIWNTEMSLEIRDSNKAYRDFVISLFREKSKTSVQ